MREGYAVGTGSAVNVNLVDTSTAAGLLMWVPVGLFYFYLAPIPFTGGSMASLATSPEMLVIYFLVPSIVRGLRTSLRDRFRTTMPLLVFVLASSVGWSMVVTMVPLRSLLSGPCEPVNLLLQIVVGCAIPMARLFPFRLFVRSL